MAAQLVEVSVEGGLSCLDFGDLYASSSSSLRRVRVRNLFQLPVRVDLRSTLGEAVHFQLDNANLDASPELEGDDDFNELFNVVGRVEQLVLQPQQSTSIVVTFRPSLADPAESGRRHSFKQIDGTVVLSYRAVSTEDSQQHVHEIPISCRTCRSIIECETTNIVIDDALPGQTRVEDIVVWNRSEIIAAYAVTCQTSDLRAAKVRLLDFDTASVVSRGELAPFANTRMRIECSARRPGEYSLMVTIDNVHNAQNSVHIRIHYVVNASTTLSNVLDVYPAKDIDFGDCVSGLRYSRALVLRNTSSERVDIQLGSNLEDEVTFDELDAESEPSHARHGARPFTVRAKPSSHPSASDDTDDPFSLAKNDRVRERARMLSGSDESDDAIQADSPAAAQKTPTDGSHSALDEEDDEIVGEDDDDGQGGGSDNSHDDEDEEQGTCSESGNTEAVSNLDAEGELRSTNSTESAERAQEKQCRYPGRFTARSAASCDDIGGNRNAEHRSFSSESSAHDGDGAANSGWQAETLGQWQTSSAPRELGNEGESNGVEARRRHSVARSHVLGDNLRGGDRHSGLRALPAAEAHRASLSSKELASSVPVGCAPGDMPEEEGSRSSKMAARTAEDLLKRPDFSRRARSESRDPILGRSRSASPPRSERKLRRPWTLRTRALHRGEVARDTQGHGTVSAPHDRAESVLLVREVGSSNQSAVLDSGSSETAADRRAPEQHALSGSRNVSDESSSLYAEQPPAPLVARSASTTSWTSPPRKRGAEHRVGKRNRRAETRPKVRRGAEHRVDEISLGAGETRTVRITYCPGDDSRTGVELTERQFRIHLRTGDMRRTLTARARVCQSHIAVRPSSVDLDAVPLGSVRRFSLVLENLSALGTSALIAHRSRTLSCGTPRVQLQPHETKEIEFEFCPHKANPLYQTQITVSNSRRAADTRIVELRSSNLDAGALDATQSSVYRLVLPSGSQHDIDFGYTHVGSLNLRVLRVRNVSGEVLDFRVRCSTEYANVYGAVTAKSAHSGMARAIRRRLMLKSIEEHHHRASAEDGKNVRLGAVSGSTAPSTQPRSTLSVLGGGDHGSRIDTLDLALAADRAGRDGTQAPDTRGDATEDLHATTKQGSALRSENAAYISSHRRDDEVSMKSGQATAAEGRGVESGHIDAAGPAVGAGDSARVEHGDGGRAEPDADAAADGATEGTKSPRESVLDVSALAELFEEVLPQASAAATDGSSQLWRTSDAADGGAREHARRGEPTAASLLAAAASVTASSAKTSRANSAEKITERSGGAILSAAGRAGAGSDAVSKGAAAHSAALQQAGSEPAPLSRERALPGNGLGRSDSDGATMSSSRSRSSTTAGIESLSAQGGNSGPAAPVSASLPVGSTLFASHAGSAAGADVNGATSSGAAQGDPASGPAASAGMRDAMGLTGRTARVGGDVVELLEQAQSILREAIQSGALERLERFTLDPGAETALFVVLWPPPSAAPRGRATALRASISLTVVREVASDVESIPRRSAPSLREVALVGKIGRAVPSVSQTHINFGNVVVSSRRSRHVVLRNDSDTALFYRLRTSGSVASGDLRITGRQGVVRAFGHRELVVTLEASLPGPYHEVVRVENVAASAAGAQGPVEIIVKAVVRKADTFAVAPEEIDVGQLRPGQRSANFRVTISNRSRHRRHFNMSAEWEVQEPFVETLFTLDRVVQRSSAVAGAAADPHERDAAIERLEQKLRIYRRKGKTAKIQRAMDKIARLRGEPTASADDDATLSSAFSSDSELDSDVEVSDLSQLRGQSLERGGLSTRSLSKVASAIGATAVGSMSIALRPFAEQVVLVAVVLRRAEAAEMASLPAAAAGRIIVSEARDRDAAKTISMHCRIEAALAAPASPRIGPHSTPPMNESDSTSQPDVTSADKVQDVGYGWRAAAGATSALWENPEPALARHLSSSILQSSRELHHVPERRATESTPAEANVTSQHRSRTPARDESVYHTAERAQHTEQPDAAQDSALRDANSPPPLEVSPEHTVALGSLDRGDDIVVTLLARNMRDVASRVLALVLSKTGEVPAAPESSGGAGSSGKLGHSREQGPELVHTAGELHNTTISPASTVVPPGQSVSFEVRSRAGAYGRQSVSVLLRDLGSGFDSVRAIQWTTRRPPVLSLRGMGDDGTLAFGACHSSDSGRPAASAVLCAENVSKEDLEVSFTSNLKAQLVFSLRDDFGEKGERFLVPAGERRDVHVGLIPAGAARELVGGIRVAAYDAAAPHELAQEETLRVTATVGRSFLEVGQGSPVLLLRSMDPEHQLVVTGQLLVRNVVPKIPTTACLTVRKYSLPIEIASTEISLAPDSPEASVALRMRLPPSPFVIADALIEVANGSLQSQVTRIRAMACTDNPLAHRVVWHGCEADENFMAVAAQWGDGSSVSSDDDNDDTSSVLSSTIDGGASNGEPSARGELSDLAFAPVWRPRDVLEHFAELSSQTGVPEIHEAVSLGAMYAVWASDDTVVVAPDPLHIAAIVEVSAPPSGAWVLQCFTDAALSAQWIDNSGEGGGAPAAATSCDESLCPPAPQGRLATGPVRACSSPKRVTGGSSLRIALSPTTGESMHAELPPERPAALASLLVVVAMQVPDTNPGGKTSAFGDVSMDEMARLSHDWQELPMLRAAKGTILHAIPVVARLCRASLPAELVASEPDVADAGELHPDDEPRYVSVPVASSTSSSSVFVLDAPDGIDLGKPYFRLADGTRAVRIGPRPTGGSGRMSHVRVQISPRALLRKRSAGAQTVTLTFYNVRDRSSVQHIRLPFVAARSPVRVSGPQCVDGGSSLRLPDIRLPWPSTAPNLLARARFALENTGGSGIVDIVLNTEPMQPFRGVIDVAVAEAGASRTGAPLTEVRLAPRERLDLRLVAKPGPRAAAAPSSAFAIAIPTASRPAGGGGSDSLNFLAGERAADDRNVSGAAAGIPVDGAPSDRVAAAGPSGAHVQEKSGASDQSEHATQGPASDVLAGGETPAAVAKPSAGDGAGQSGRGNHPENAFPDSARGSGSTEIEAPARSDQGSGQSGDDRRASEAASFSLSAPSAGDSSYVQVASIKLRSSGGFERSIAVMSRIVVIPDLAFAPSRRTIVLPVADTDGSAESELLLRAVGGTAAARLRCEVASPAGLAAVAAPAGAMEIGPGVSRSLRISVRWVAGAEEVGTIARAANQAADASHAEDMRQLHDGADDVSLPEEWLQERREVAPHVPITVRIVDDDLGAEMLRTSLHVIAAPDHASQAVVAASEAIAELVNQENLSRSCSGSPSPSPPRSPSLRPSSHVDTAQVQDTSAAPVTPPLASKNRSTTQLPQQQRSVRYSEIVRPTEDVPVLAGDTKRAESVDATASDLSSSVSAVHRSPPSSPARPPASPGLSPQASGREESASGILLLRGCAPVRDTEGSFELHLGRIVAQSSASALEGALTLVNSGSAPAPFTVRAFEPLRVSRHSGTLPPGSSVSVALRLEAVGVGRVSAHVVIRSVAAPGGALCVRVMGDVAPPDAERDSSGVQSDSGEDARKAPDSSGALDGPGSLTSNRGKAGDLLYVYADEPGTTSVDMRTVYAGHLYQHRSIVVENTSSFAVHASLRAEIDAADTCAGTELVFSLASDAMRIVNMLHLAARSSVRVFLFFRPGTYDTVTRDLEINMSVRTRQVFGEQHTVVLAARCARAAFYVSPPSCSFTAASCADRAGGDASVANTSAARHVFEPRHAVVTVSNTLDEPLSVLVRNSSRLFVCHSARERGHKSMTRAVEQFCVTVPARGSVPLSVRPRVLGDDQRDALLGGALYAQEYITLYNSASMAEKFRVVCSLRLGHFPVFSIVPDESHSVTAKTLERLATDFVRMFLAFWNDAARAAGHGSDSAPAPRVLARGAIGDQRGALRALLDEFVALKDELVYFGVRNIHATLPLQLGHLVFATVFDSEEMVSLRTVDAAEFAEWSSVFLHFLHFFPNVEQRFPQFAVLRARLRS